MASQSSIESLPTELIAEVLAILGSTSVEDLRQARQSTKMFNQAAGSNFVYKKVSLERFPVVKYRPSREYTEFMERCRDCGNAEALFRQGVIDFFQRVQHSEGLEVLGKAAKEGHVEAQYILSIIMILSGDEHKEKGMEMLSTMRKSEGAGRRLKEYREKVRAILSRINTSGKPAGITKTGRLLAMVVFVIGK